MQKMHTHTHTHTHTRTRTLYRLIGVMDSVAFEGLFDKTFECANHLLFHPNDTERLLNVLKTFYFYPNNNTGRLLYLLITCFFNLIMVQNDFSP